MTRIDPIGRTLQNYAAAVADSDNVASEEELKENGLPASRQIPQSDDDRAVSAEELEDYLLDLASAHGRTITIDNLDYAVTDPDNTITAACQTSAVDIQSMRSVVELLQIMMSTGSSIGEITGYLTYEGMEGHDDSCGAFSFIAASGQLMNELAGFEAPDNRPALANLMIRSIAIRMGGLTRALRNGILGTRGNVADDSSARESILQGILLDVDLYPVIENIDNFISILKDKIEQLEPGSSILPVLNDLYIFALILKTAAHLEEAFMEVVGDDPERSGRTIDLYRRTIGSLMSAYIGQRPELAAVLSDMIKSLLEAVSQLAPGCQNILPPIPEILPVDTSDEERVAQLEAAWGDWLIKAKAALMAQVRTTLPPIEQAEQGPTTTEVTFTPMFVDDINLITKDKVQVVDSATGQPVAGIVITNVRADGNRLVVSLTIDEGVQLGDYSVHLIGVGSWHSTQITVRPSISANLPLDGVDFSVTAEHQDIEIAAVSFVESSGVEAALLQAVRDRAELVRLAESTVEEQWLDPLQEDNLEFTARTYGTFAVSPDVDRQVAGQPDGEKDITLGGGVDAAFSAGFLTDNYRLRLGVLGRGLFEAAPGEGPNAGMASLRAGFAGANLYPSFIPEFNLGFGYRHSWSDADTPSHPQGDALSFDIQASEVFPLTSRWGLGLTTGFSVDYSVNSDTYGWEEWLVPAGARLRYSSDDAALDLALGFLYKSRAMREMTGIDSHANALESYGFFAQARVYTGQGGGNFLLDAAYLNNPESGRDSASARLQYMYPFDNWSLGGGVDFEHQDYLGPTIDDLLFNLKAEGEVLPAFNLFGQVSAGPTWIDYPEETLESQSGATIQLTLGAAIGGSSSITDELEESSPSGNPIRLTEEQYLMSDTATGRAILFDDPFIARLFGIGARDLNNAIALRYLLAFKMNLLKADYTLDESLLPADISRAFTDADTEGPYGYGVGAAGGGELMPPRGDGVSLGSVAPVVCYLGYNPDPEHQGLVDNYTPYDAQYRDRFEDELYMFEGRGEKLRVLTVGANRRYVIEQEDLAVRPVHDGNSMTADLIGAVLVMIEADQRFDRVSLDIFLDKKGLDNRSRWDHISEFFGGTRREFVNQLMAELQGEVVGQAMWAIVKWSLTEQGKPLAEGIESIDEDQVELVMLQAYDERLRQMPRRSDAQPVPAPTPTAPAPAPAPVVPTLPAVSEEPDLVPAVSLAGGAPVIETGAEPPVGRVL
ncbi:hypothetical protein HZC35_03565 [Candidatus Saganbacteria bacterium]|nr:hypothetical protein [Candidatus Saganbacteria bacterium]